MREPVAIAVSDIHLSARAPIFRSVEENWIETQRGYLRQIIRLSEMDNPKVTGGKYILPILIAGDIFDKALLPPEVLTLALEELDGAYAVAGNHDLLHHRLEEMHRSAYGVLVAAWHITDVKPGHPIIIEDSPYPIRLHGFPYGVEVEPLKKPSKHYLEIALVHDYIWRVGSGYNGAPEEKKVNAHLSRVRGYDIALFGDNHMTVNYNLSRDAPQFPAIFNPGGFAIRKSDEKLHKPMAGIIYSDGTIEPHYLDISQDRYLDLTQLVIALTNTIGMNSFVEELLELADHSLDFAEHLYKLLEREKVPESVKSLIFKALDTGAKR